MSGPTAERNRQTSLPRRSLRNFWRVTWRLLSAPRSRRIEVRSVVSKIGFAHAIVVVEQCEQRGGCSAAEVVVSAIAAGFAAME